MNTSRVRTHDSTARSKSFLPFIQRSLYVAAVALGTGINFVPTVSCAETAVERAEQLIWDQGEDGDPSAGRLALETAVKDGDVEASRVLGRHLIYGWVFEKDVSRGLKLLTNAADAGDVTAKTQLAMILLFGAAGSIDKPQARALLESASDQGDPTAMRLLGEQLVFGTEFEKDTASGVALLERAGSLGDVKAMVSLGTMYLFSRELDRDRGKALELFETAATLGDGSGLEVYGADMMWREIDADAAEAMLNRAGELGEAKAYATLAQGAMYGYLGGGSKSRQKYQNYAVKALDADMQDVAILEAERKQWGIGSRANGPEAVSILTNAAEKGNSSAAKYLIALLRDGNNLNVRRSASDARAAFETYSHLLSDKERAQYDITLHAAKARTSEAYAVVSTLYADQPELRTEAFGKEMFKSNPNVALYILQVRLKSQGVYNGPLNGYATNTTLSAVYKACIKSLPDEWCDDNVMRPDVIGALLAQR